MDINSKINKAKIFKIICEHHNKRLIFLIVISYLKKGQENFKFTVNYF